MRNGLLYSYAYEKRTLALDPCLTEHIFTHMGRKSKLHTLGWHPTVNSMGRIDRHPIEIFLQTIGSLPQCNSVGYSFLASWFVYKLCA